MEGAGHPVSTEYLAMYPRAHLAVNAMCLPAGGLGVLPAANTPGQPPPKYSIIKADYRPEVTTE